MSKENLTEESKAKRYDIIIYILEESKKYTPIKQIVRIGIIMLNEGDEAINLELNKIKNINLTLTTKQKAERYDRFVEIMNSSIMTNTEKLMFIAINALMKCNPSTHDQNLDYEDIKKLSGLSDIELKNNLMKLAKFNLIEFTE